MPNNNLLDTALAYATHGWFVFPCRPKGKEPLTPHGFQDATTDLDTIHAWWTRWPDANIAIACGFSNLLVLDADVRHFGDESLRKLENRYSPLPPTPTVSTGGGGSHSYFSSPPDTTVRSRTIAEGLDLKGAGGYVIAPPSIHPSGWPYEWEASFHYEDIPLAPIPDWLLQLATRSKATQAPPVYATIPTGQRNSTLTSLAGTMRRRGMVQPEIEAALLVVNELRCQPPLPEDHVRTIAASVSRYEPAQDSTSLPQDPTTVELPPHWWPSPISQLPAVTELNWLWEGFLAPGLVTDFYGLWKSGKTSLLSALLSILASGGSLADRPVRPASALIISEEPPSKWKRRAIEFSIGDHVSLICRPFTRRATWQDWQLFTDHLLSLLQANHYDLLVLDSLPNLWPVLNENDAGEVLRALVPLQACASHDAAVFLVRHPRKSDGSEATAGRGSGAISGFVDIIMEFRRFDPSRADDTRRILSVFSREEPFEVVIDWESGPNYVSIGDKAETKRHDRIQIILDYLAQHPNSSATTIHADWPESPRPSTRTIRQDLDHAFASHLVARSGSGVKGHPFLFSLPNSLSDSGTIPEPTQPASNASPPATIRFWQAPSLKVPESNSPSPPTVPCPSCSSTAYWRSPDGPWLCASCSPQVPPDATLLDISSLEAS